MALPNVGYVGGLYTLPQLMGKRPVQERAYPCIQAHPGMWRKYCSFLVRSTSVVVFANRQLPAGGIVMVYEGTEMRVDWVMRQFVDSIIQYLSGGGDQANARMNMIERGVPVHVQDRVLERLGQLH